MRIVIAPDSFKHSLSAKEVCEAVRKGILSIPGNWDVTMVPMADGGEGTVHALVDATGGKYYTQPVRDPMLRNIKAQFGILGDGKTAVIEMSAASGIELLKEDERNPWLTTSFGTGELIKAALDKGCTRIIVGIGGSATNDGGMGMAKALGIKFLDSKGESLGEGGGELGKLASIDISAADPRLQETEVIVACDVNNPLTGAQGASRVYGPQKGAGPNMVKELDQNLSILARLVKETLGKEIKNIPGSGAAGGLGAGLMAFTNARLQPGFDIVAKETRLGEKLQGCDLVITGEGKIDSQTQYGKTPMGVLKEAKKYNLPVIAIAGTLGEGYLDLYDLGFDAIFSIIDKPMSLDEAMITAEELLMRAGQTILRMWLAAK